MQKKTKNKTPDLTYAVHLAKFSFIAPIFFADTPTSSRIDVVIFFQHSSPKGCLSLQSSNQWDAGNSINGAPSFFLSLKIRHACSQFQLGRLCIGKGVSSSSFAQSEKGPESHCLPHWGNILVFTSVSVCFFMREVKQHAGILIWTGQSHSWF